MDGMEVEFPPLINVIIMEVDEGRRQNSERIERIQSTVCCVCVGSVRWVACFSSVRTCPGGDGKSCIFLYSKWKGYLCLDLIG